MTWVSTGLAAAVGPILRGRAFDLTGPYESLLTRLAIVTVFVAGLMLLMPAYDAVGSRREARPDRARVSPSAE